MRAEHVTVGRRVTISYNVMIADSDFQPRDPIMRRQNTIAVAPYGKRDARPPFVTKPVVIEDDAQIGIGAIILKGVRIGSGAQIGAGRWSRRMCQRLRVSPLPQHARLWLAGLP